MNDQQRRAMFAKQINRLSKKPKKFTAVVFDDTQKERAIRMGLNQSPHKIADSVSFKGTKIIGTVSENNRDTFMKKVKQFKNFEPETIHNLAMTMGVIKRE